MDAKIYKFQDQPLDPFRLFQQFAPCCVTRPISVQHSARLEFMIYFLSKPFFFVAVCKKRENRNIQYAFARVSGFK